jgi:hypothetical protein
VDGSRCLFQSLRKYLTGFPSNEQPGGLAFLRDREELWGREWEEERRKRMRAEALQSMRNNFEFLETMMSSEARNGRLAILPNEGFRTLP